MAAPSPQQLRDLALDLAVEARKLAALVVSLAALGEVSGDRLRIDAAVLRLRTLALALWPEVREELNTFQGWLKGPWA